MFDGAGNTDEQRGSNVGGQTRAANESIQEVQIITNQFDAEWGRASGAVVNAVTKSGTNQLTGSAFSFFTGKGVTSKDFFTRVNGFDKPDVANRMGLHGRGLSSGQLTLLRQRERIVLRSKWSSSFRAAVAESVGGRHEELEQLWASTPANPRQWAAGLRRSRPIQRVNGNNEPRTDTNDKPISIQTVVALTSVSPTRR